MIRAQETRRDVVACIRQTGQVDVIYIIDNNAHSQTENRDLPCALCDGQSHKYLGWTVHYVFPPRTLLEYNEYLDKY